MFELNRRLYDGRLNTKLAKDNKIPVYWLNKKVIFTCVSFKERHENAI